MKILPAAERPLREALGLGAALLARAAEERVPWMAASVVRGPAVVLGAAQRAGRVVRLSACAAACAPVLRRATAGTAVYVGERAIVWTLALPHVAALVPDATLGTLLNRNVRPFLEGLRSAGALAHYFGREWLSVGKRPAAVVGFEVSPDGAVLLEVLAGFDAPVAVPAALASDEEHAVDRWLGKAPAGLAEVIPVDPLEIARAVVRAVVRRTGAPAEEAPRVDALDALVVTRDDDPLPEGCVVGPTARVPIGWIDTGAVRATGWVWLGGDVLAPAHVLRAIADGAHEPAEAAVQGATIGDLVDAVRRARA